MDVQESKDSALHPTGAFLGRFTQYKQKILIPRWPQPSPVLLAHGGGRKSAAGHTLSCWAWLSEKIVLRDKGIRCIQSWQEKVDMDQEGGLAGNLHCMFEIWAQFPEPTKKRKKRKRSWKLSKNCCPQGLDEWSTKGALILLGACRKFKNNRGLEQWRRV